MPGSFGPARESAILFAMRLLTFLYHGLEHAGVLTGEGIAPILEINSRYDLHLPNNLLEIVRNDIRDIPVAGVRPLPLSDIELRLPYSDPPKIWCVGLNYKSHAEDIAAVQPDEPGSFMKPASCMFQPGGEILLPPPDISDDVDAEGELAVIIGRRCRFVPPEKAHQVVYGYTTTMDLTALDILRRNPRYLTRAKSIDTFFSFGPVIVTADEIPDPDSLEIVTEHNGSVCSRDFARNMKTRPLDLVAFHSNYFTLNPGDIISTGCPKGARIKAGDRVRARIDGIGTLDATVRAGERRAFGFV
jgi:2-keto-4-pentenoate hydratase/2-oxohepta-3-ene-1,7-dioic acid hydratase in catechol pathway